MSAAAVSFCDICQKPAHQKCGGCHSVFYCCKTHQKQAWKMHKITCRPFKIVENEILGRHLISTKPIKAGDVVLKEPPLIWGPSQSTMPVCLGCGKLVHENNSKPCFKCGWPMCSEICEKAPAHIPECRYTVQRGNKVSIKNFGIVHPTYQCITVLRCLYQKQFLPEIWNRLDILESHCSQRKGTPKYENERIVVAEFIRRFFKLEHVFYESEIMRVSGIITVNGHEVPLADLPYVAIYEITSMFEHSCRANCAKSFTNDGKLLITAGENIQAGEHLSICYTDPLWGTPNRRHHLNETKFFWCSCSRCSDPTEFGTYFTALNCQKMDCQGKLLPKTFLENQIHEKSEDWICDVCCSTLSSYSVQEVLEKVGTDLAELKKGDSESCKRFISSCDEFFPSNHFYLTDVKLALSELIGQESEDGLVNVSDEDLEYKRNICQELFSLFSALVPAEKRVKGMVLFELHSALSEIGRRRAVMHGDHEEMQAKLLEAKHCLEQVVDLLKHEPTLLPEGKIYQQAKCNITSIDLVLQNLDNNRKVDIVF